MKLTLAALSYAVAGFREIYGDNQEAATTEFSMLSPQDRAEAAQLFIQAALKLQALDTPTDGGYLRLAAGE